MAEPTSVFTRLVLAPNAGPMTLEGTNSYLLAAPGSASVVIVDPGPDDAGHIDALVGHGPVELVLITHLHGDHTEASAELHRRTGAPVRALDPAFCIGGELLNDGEEIAAAGLRISVLATPGHTADSVCFVLDEDGAAGSILTGDTLLGRGTTVLARPDGDLGAYLDSLGRLKNLGPMTVLPGHGPMLPNLEEISSAYLEHRLQRLDEVRAARERLGANATVATVTDAVYRDIEPSVRFAAEYSVEAQLAYLDSAGNDLTS
ncbi:MBL fold metallo-hydrolase [Mycetocola zhadangensis]|uniref:MBL fold metallo-hydrolase n=1 Tax=Mycetocola zhadangensis TaxID=1164595 RepID=UPI003A4E3E77